ncbi:MFS transporter [Methylobacterium terricola]|uniref:MFS transporter n=1 Tax=Methylobacterium terricola TaxID=2583531 RepID=A0A5C4LRT2_9HYPH|nr:MFS transporter [Methylobacterium terricola]TNC15757.1 MFS transporter [Methylobacterium terricola]
MRWGSFPAFVGLQGALYAAYGLEAPFLPSFLAERGLGSAEIGLVLAAGTLVRLVAGPAAGHLADRRGAPRAVLGLAAAASGVIAFAYLPGHGLIPLLAVSLVHAAVTAPLAPLADALALAAAARERVFAYGWVRGAGSAAFVLGTLIAGQLVGWAGLASVVAASGGMFLVMALAATRVPQGRPESTAPSLGPSGIRELLRLAPFRRLLLVAALVIGSHALNDAFAVIRWRAAGLGPGTISLLWSAAVASEVVVFVLAGPWLLARIGPARAAMLAAGTGVLRWGAMAASGAVPVLAVAQASHGLTFALLHLAVMRRIGELVPAHLAATGQTLYGTFGLGLASAALTATGGLLYGALGAGAFWIMAALSAAGLPVAAGLGRDAPRTEASGARRGQFERRDSETA